MISEIPFPEGISLLGRQGISTFSILLMLAFLSASYLMPRELKRRGLEPGVSDWCLLLAIVGALVGSKVFFVFEVWPRIWIVELGFWDTFYRVFFTWSGMKHAGGESMWSYLFSGSGLVFYGGYFFAFLFIYLYLRFKKLDVWRYGDIFIICLALAYSIGRLGCFVSGDGCFGHAAGVNLPVFTWVYGPADGSCSQDPALSWNYPYMCTSGVRVWNTPVIESILSLGLFAFLMLWARHQNFRPGMMIAFFMIWNAIVRFFVEFLRLNDAVIPLLAPPTYQQNGSDLLLRPYVEESGSIQTASEYFLNWHWYGFTQAQIVAIFLCVIALSWIFAGKLYKREQNQS